MARSLILWSRNPVDPFPSDLEESLKLLKKVNAIIDGLIKKGEMVDMGAFLNGTSEYIIGERG